MNDIHQDKILILVFGSQYTQLIARRVRECHVYCELHPFDMALNEIKAFQPTGITLSGGPKSVYEDGAPAIVEELFELGVPVLGLCYGMQLMSRHFGGEVVPAGKREYGHAELVSQGNPGPLFDGFFSDGTSSVWMSHGDHVETMPQGFEVVAKTANAPENQTPKLNPNNIPATIVPIATNPPIIKYFPKNPKSFFVMKAKDEIPKTKNPVTIPADDKALPSVNITAIYISGRNIIDSAIINKPSPAY